MQVMQAALNRDVRIIDMSGAFRLKRADAYEKFYGHRHPRPDLLERFVYGLPELNRERIRGARYVASPGCFATSVELGLLAFAKAGLLRGRVESVGITGSSGAGVTPSATTHHPVRAVNLRTYRPLLHQHAPEIEDTLTAAGATSLSLSFVPVSAPLTRGIFTTSFLRVPSTLDPAELDRIVRAQFASEPFVRVPAKRLPEVVAIAGSNYAEVGIAMGEIEGSERVITCFSAVDNLVKGGAGQAVQNLNLMLELDERTGLEDPGSYP
jgi:N-acetyl-gamma-glutamyl-phosphate reductase